MNVPHAQQSAATSRPLSEVFGLPQGSFVKFLEQKKAALKRVNEAQKKHVRDVRDRKLTWAQ